MYLQFYGTLRVYTTARREKQPRSDVSESVGITGDQFRARLERLEHHSTIILKGQEEEPLIGPYYAEGYQSLDQTANVSIFSVWPWQMEYFSRTFSKDIISNSP